MNFEEACAALEAAKEVEKKANAARIEAEEAVLACMPKKLEGSVTEHGDGWKASVTYGFNRTVDAAALSAIRSDIPAALFDQAFEYAPKIKLEGLRYLMNNEPETYLRLSSAVTVKPAKPSVKVERVVVEEQKEAA